ncbi:MAG: CarD family transcriptional regulator, partial [Nocardioidaceae bacterium]
MSLQGLADLVLQDKVLATTVEDARDGRVRALDLTGPSALRPFVVKGLVDAGRTVLAVAATAREAEDLVTYLKDLVDPDTVAYYPAWETLPHERLSPRSDTVGRRLAVLRRLKHPGTDSGNGPVKVVVAPVRSILQPQVKGLADLVPVELAVGDEADLEDVVRRLAGAAYSRVDLVERRGEFAVRGGIVDVFPPTEVLPLRVVFWCDVVEEIRSFSVADQRSLEPVPRLWAPPCRELLLTDEVRVRARELGRSNPELAEIAEKMAEGHAVEGMESLTPALVDEMEMLVDLMPADTHVLVLDPERARSRAHDLVATSEEFLHASWAAAAGGGKAPVDLGAASYRSLADVRARSLAQDKPWWSISPFGLDPDTDAHPAQDAEVDTHAVESRVVSIRPVEAYRGDLERAVADIKQWLTNGSRVVLLNEGHGPAERMVEVLKEHDVPARLVPSIDNAPEPGVVHVSTSCLDHGFVDDEQCLAVLTGDDLTGQRSSTKDLRRMPTRRKKQIDPLELAPGDYVVHEQHGVGRYVEMAQRTVQGATREYLVIEYGSSKRGQPADRLFVPADTLDQVTRYVGGEQPSLDRLGGGDWTKRKNRARKAVREIAAELIKLYAARQATRGHAFGADSPWQRELEDAFPFVETVDQLSTVDEVKRDMEQQ